MKKIYLIMLIVAGSLATKAQSLKATDYSGTDVNGQVLQLWITTADSAPEKNILIKMIANGNKKIMAKRKVISSVAGTQNLFCWVECYGPTVSISPTALSMVKDDQWVLASHYFSNGLVGSTSIAYTVYDSLNPSDSVGFIVKYHVSTSAVNEMNLLDAEISNGFPNPVKDKISFTISEKGSKKINGIRLLDIYGKISDVNFSYNTNQEINLDLSEKEMGVYFVLFEYDGKCMAVKKIAVLN